MGGSWRGGAPCVGAVHRHGAEPGVGPEGLCHVRCFVPNDQMLHILRIVNEFHRGRDPPAIAIQDREATVKLFRPSFCKVDWRLFIPETLSWEFHGERYLEALNETKTSQASQNALDKGCPRIIRSARILTNAHWRENGGRKGLNLFIIDVTRPSIPSVTDRGFARGTWRESRGPRGRITPPRRPSSAVPRRSPG